MDPIRDVLELDINYANPQDHVPEAERNNRTIKERIRASYHRLPYHTLTKAMVKVLVSESAKKLNFFPARHGISNYYSPRMILHRQNLDYNKHCTYAFGSYVQVNNDPDPTNTNAPRTLDCIYLRSTGQQQGGHDCLHLPTNRIITRAKVTPIPITAGVMVQVQTIADQERMPKGLKISNRYQVVLYDSTWIPGVDFEDSDYDSDYEEDSSTDDSSRSSHSSTSTNDDDDDDDDDDFDVMSAEYDELSNAANEGPTDGPNSEPDDEVNMPTIAGFPEANIAVANRRDNPNEVVNNNGSNDDDNEGEEAGMIEIEQQDEQQPAEDSEEETQQQAEVEPEVRKTRSGRVSRPPERFDEYYMHLQTQIHPEDRTIEYTTEEGRVIATILQYFQYKQMRTNKKLSKKFVKQFRMKTNTKSTKKARKKAEQFVQTYSLKAGLKKFGETGKESTLKEMKQLDDREVYYPVDVNDLTDQERARAMESLLFLVEKRDGKVKARFVANGSSQREYMGREQSASPTVMTESIMITSVIDAKQKRDVMTCDIPNAFVQTEMDKTEKGERVTMKIRGALVDILLEMDYEKYGSFVTKENGRRILYVAMSKALYGMLDSAILYYKKFRKDIEEQGYEVNPYDPCVANKMIEGKQHTVCWHVDDLKASHVHEKVNDDFLEWLNKKYGTLAKVTATRGKEHDYLAMILRYTKDGKVIVDMTRYVEKMVEDFPDKLKEGAKLPWTERLFKVDENSPILDEERAKTMYTFVMKAMFVCKRGRPDVQPAVAFLATRVKEPNEQDYRKLVRLMEYMKATAKDVLTLEANEEQSNEWWVDASFAVHPDYKSHTGAVHSLGKGAVASISTKQKVNSRSSTEAELIGIDDVISKILWSKRFIEAQGFPLKVNVVYRDNTSSMKLEENGRASASKRTRHFNIRLFHITDLIQRKELTIKYCRTEDMIADYHTKPLVGEAFERMRRQIMNIERSRRIRQQRCVENVNRRNY